MKHRFLAHTTAAAIVGMLVGGVAWAAANVSDTVRTAGLLPRQVLFGNPERTSPQISPDGKRIAYLAPVNGVLNVFVGPADRIETARPVTQDKNRGIRIFFWSYTNEHILYLQDTGGDENWRVYAVDLKSNETRDLTPLDGVAARISGTSHRTPEIILVGLNDRDARLHDLHTVNIRTGERTLLQKNEGFTGFLVDEDLKVRFASRVTPDGGSELLEPGADGAWKPVEKIGMEDSMTTGPAGFNKAGNVLYMRDSRDRNTAAVFAVNLNTRERKLLAEHEKADAGGLMVHPTENTVQAVGFNYKRNEWKILDPAIEADFAALRNVADGDFGVTSRTLDDQTWIVAYTLDNGPTRFYLYDRAARKATFLFTSRPALENLTLARMHPVVIKARDGMELVSYLSLPPESDPDGDGKPNQPVPLVLNVHGGPWARDGWGFNPEAQWLANRGYACLAVNFRGSTGFGKRFINAANSEWGAKMHDDLLDAVKWAVDNKVADPKKVAIMGGSYGGYATLVGLTFTPEVFACGVSIVGPSNLVTLLNSIPPYWAPMIDMFTKRVGDHRTEEGRKLLNERSPLSRVEAIRRPLLVGQGANDPRVKQAESDQIVKAMQSKNIPVTYVLYPDEGHGFARPENRMSFYAVAEAFLAQHLGGRFEPIGDDFAGASIQVPAGADQVPGLKQALPQ